MQKSLMADNDLQNLLGHFQQLQEVIKKLSSVMTVIIESCVEGCQDGLCIGQESAAVTSTNCCIVPSSIHLKLAILKSSAPR